MDLFSQPRFAGKPLRFQFSRALKPFAAVVVTAAFLAPVLPVRADTPSPEEKADALFSGLIHAGDAGAAVLVAQNGKIVFEKGYGLADREQPTAVTTKTIFRIGSITKQFTAAAILKLEEEGKLSVKDKLSKYVPDFPRGNAVTLHQLLTHTSGIANYTEKPGFMLLATNAVAIGDLIKLFKNDPYDFHKNGQTMNAQKLEDLVAAKVDPAVYDSLVGKYDYGQGKAIMTMTREGNRLFAQLPGQPKYEIFPESETEFFWKAVNAQVSFVKDKNGKVIKAIHHQHGQTFDAPKIE